MSTGRPTMYTIELAREICRAIATSSKGLKHICAENEHFPAWRTIYEWRFDNEEFAQMYAQAKRAQAELLAEDILEISDDTTLDTVYDKDGNPRQNSEWVNRSRLKVDTRKWIAAKLLPKVYGDRPQDDTKSAADTLIEKLLEKIDK